MTHTLGAIAVAVQGELEGDAGIVIHGVREVEEAGEGEICVVIDRKYAKALPRLGASAFILPRGVDAGGRPAIRTANLRQALIRVLLLFHPGGASRSGVEAGAFVAPGATLGRDVFVAAGAVVRDGARVGDRCQILSHAVVGENAVVGEESVLFPNVTLYPGVALGRRVRIHSGTVVGSDGFGYVCDAAGLAQKIPQVGTVEIGDDVEIGANCAVDRATIGATRIGAGTKIDNLVQVGHNCQIGRNCRIVGLAGLSGSVTLGEGCVLAGQAGVADHVTIADHAVVGAQAGVHRDLPTGNWLGSPAIPAEEAYRVYTALSRLPEMRKALRAVEQRLRRLEELLALAGQHREGT